MIYRLRPTKDTFITDFRRLNVPQTGSNFGSSEILHLFRVAPVSSSSGITSGSVARLLTQFDVSSVPGLTGSLASGTVSFKLRMKNAQHGRTLPSSFDVQVHSVTTSWDEGRGHDVDLFTDKGFANWDKAKSNVLWNNAGGDFSDFPVSEAHFDGGNEDLEIDVTPHVTAWLTGSPNYGFLVRLSSSLETSSQDYYVKMFHSRESHFGDFLPYLEASWDDSVRTLGSATLADDGQFFVNVTNLKDSYESDEQPRLNVFVRPKDYNPAVLLTASDTPAGVIVDRSYYRIVNERTDEVVVPFGTGSTETTRLSYTPSGSYFDFFMNTLPRGNVYRLSFLFDISGRKQIVDQGFKFRVV